MYGIPEHGLGAQTPKIAQSETQEFTVATSINMMQSVLLDISELVNATIDRIQPILGTTAQDTDPRPALPEASCTLQAAIMEQYRFADDIRIRLREIVGSVRL